MLNGGNGRGVALGAFLLGFWLSSASAQIVVSANDNKVMLINGVNTVVANPPPDTVTVIDLNQTPPKVLGEVNAPSSVVGPPSSVAITPDERLALVGSAMKIDPADPKKTIADARSGVSHAHFTPDGKMALVTRDGDHFISVLAIDDDRVEYTKRDISAGLRPYGLDIAPDGSYAAVANIGRGGGDSDTVSLIDLRAKPPKVVETVSVGQTPEGLKISPDGKSIAVVVMNGSNKPKESPFFNDNGLLVLLAVDGLRLSRMAEAPIGHWSQAAAFSRDGKTILVSNMVEKDIQVLRLEGQTVKDTGQRIKVNGGPAALRTAEK